MIISCSQAMLNGEVPPGKWTVGYWNAAGEEEECTVLADGEDEAWSEFRHLHPASEIPLRDTFSIGPD